MVGKSEISNCINYGNVTLGDEGGIYTGGIVGVASDTDEIRVYKCINEGKIKGIITTGGIVGMISIRGTIEKCSNIGEIISSKVGGGIVGHMNQKNGQSYSVIRECYNSGSVSGIQLVGGIVGYLCGESQQGTVEKCYNKGSVSASNGDVGSIIGKQIKYDSNAKLENLYYLNTVGLYAVNNQEQYNNETIKEVEDDLKTYEEFIEWINNK